jgi:hypothetical protein
MTVEQTPKTAAEARMKCMVRPEELQFVEGEEKRDMFECSNIFRICAHIGVTRAMLASH